MNEENLTEFLKDDVKINNNEATFCNTQFLAGGFPHLVSPRASTEEVTRQIKRDGVSEQESDLLQAQRQWAALETAQTQSPGIWPSNFSNPQPCLVLKVQPQKAAAPARALQGCPDSGFVWQHNSLPCEKAWPTHRQLEVTSTPDDTIQSLLCLAFWFLIDIRWQVEINAGWGQCWSALTILSERLFRITNKTKQKLKNIGVLKGLNRAQEVQGSRAGAFKGLASPLRS